LFIVVNGELPAQAICLLHCRLFTGRSPDCYLSFVISSNARDTLNGPVVVIGSKPEISYCCCGLFVDGVFVFFFNAWDTLNGPLLSFVNTLLYRQCRRLLLLVALLAAVPVFTCCRSYRQFFFVFVGTQPIDSSLERHTFNSSVPIRHTDLLLGQSETRIVFVSSMTHTAFFISPYQSYRHVPSIGMQPIPSQACSRNLDRSPATILFVIRHTDPWLSVTRCHVTSFDVASALSHSSPGIISSKCWMMTLKRPAY